MLFFVVGQPERFIIRAMRRLKALEEPKHRRVVPPDAADTSYPMPAWHRKIGVRSLAGIAVLLCFAGYVPATFVDRQKIDNFCADVTPGLEISKLPELIEKYNVELYPGYDALGKKVDHEEEWMTGVAAITTIGQHRCTVFHNQKLVTRVEPFSG